MAIFEKYHLSTAERTGWQQFWTAVQSINKDQQVHRLIEEITKLLIAISAHTTALAPTAQEISDVVTSELEGKMDRSIFNAIKRLQVRYHHLALLAVFLTARQTSRARHSSLPSDVSHFETHNDNGHHEIDQSSQKQINAQSVEIHQTIYNLPNTHIVGHVPTMHGFVPRVVASSEQPGVSLAEQFLNPGPAYADAHFKGAWQRLANPRQRLGQRPRHSKSAIRTSTREPTRP
jgi:hypothetical protein